MIVVFVTALIAALIGAVAWGSLTEPVAEGETPHPLSAIRWDGWALIASMAVFNQAPGAAWSRWTVRRLLLTRHGLPDDLEESLKTAREQGILRAVGTSCRFQHTKIQDHLAHAPEVN